MRQMEIALFIKKNNIKKVAIYPYGYWGKQIEAALLDIVPGISIIKFDQNGDGIDVFQFNKDRKYKDYYFLIATEKRPIKNQIIFLLLQAGIPDKNIIKIFDYGDLFIDDRADKYIDENLIEYCKTVRKKVKRSSCETRKDNERVIVSLTSFPVRISFIRPAIESLLSQTVRAYQLILWLAEEEFPRREKDVPQDVVMLQNEYFRIEWCRNTKSYKKLIPTLEKYPDFIIVTADDDLIYEVDWLEKLLVSHEKYPNDIICHRVTKIVKDGDGQWATLPGGWEYYSGACALNKLCGGAGVLFPAGIFTEDVREQELFLRLAPTNDDQWFWMMGLLSGRKVRAAEHAIVNLNINKEMDITPKLWQINDKNEKRFWIDFYNILAVYPEVEDILENEYMQKQRSRGL